MALRPGWRAAPERAKPRGGKAIVNRGNQKQHEGPPVKVPRVIEVLVKNARFAAIWAKGEGTLVGTSGLQHTFACRSRRGCHSAREEQEPPRGARAAKSRRPPARRDAQRAVRSRRHRCQREPPPRRAEEVAKLLAKPEVSAGSEATARGEGGARSRAAVGEQGKYLH